MNYLAIAPELIKPITRVHMGLKKPFLSFLLNDEYRINIAFKRKGCQMFVHPTRGEIKVEGDGTLNEAGKKRYHTFLKLYAKRGQDFLIELEQQLAQKKIQIL